MKKLAINDLLKKELYFRGVEVEFVSGKKWSLNQMAVGFISSQSNMCIHAELDEYQADFFYQKVQNDVVSCKAVLTPKTDCVKDKIRKITSLKAFGFYSQDALLIKQDFTDSGVVERQKKDKKGLSENYLSIYEKNGQDNAVTFTGCLQAKFYSHVAYEQRKNGILFRLETSIPVSFVGKIESEEWTVHLHSSTVDALEQSVREYPKTNEFVKPIGWSTWDYYFTSATENDVKANVDFIAGNKTLKEKVRYVAIDDGWQQREGDWICGARYPSGLKSLVSYIQEKDMEAGVWIAPTRLHFLCGTVMRRHDFLVRNDLGDPIMDEDMYVLDPTHPDGEKFLRETFAYLKDCGFTFYKLDFVSNLLKCDRFYDKSAGPYDALRKLFNIARECIGQESHLMGCSLPYCIGKGVADSRRAGLDIHNTFSHLKKCLEMAWYQFASNERVHRLDLDYLIVRGKDTTDDKQTNVLNPLQGLYQAEQTDKFRWRDGEDFSYNEAKCWCAILLMSGSSLFLGDNLQRLNEKGLSLVYTVLKYADFHSSTPVLSGGEGLPEIWKKKETGSVYVFNFGDEQKEHVLQIENGRYYDAFENKEYVVSNGTLCLSIQPHDCICLYIDVGSI